MEKCSESNDLNGVEDDIAREEDSEKKNSTSDDEDDDEGLRATPDNAFSFSRLLRADASGDPCVLPTTFPLAALRGGSRFLGASSGCGDELPASLSSPSFFVAVLRLPNPPTTRGPVREGTDDEEDELHELLSRFLLNLGGLCGASSSK
ncbi:hypothetical protein IscW_ISCW019901 [Ixodes scapularis]|uniref:Uncharacterized protein n=1 Tax=Ixodes scapularis TaxID=6945 RepID=B7PRW4_IXOSC|nr:hypothetical protein IscW_ISCW019901 [Ixodes scapularis]|eukprot:XP_002401290.1 hypothetical protein IscW_ISCW019901 [Ixodes scapularis]